MATLQPVRVALLVPPGPDWHRWIRVLTDYVFTRGWQLATVCGTVEDALQELAGDRADRIVVIHAHQLAPVVEILTENPTAPPQTVRRPRRTQRVWPEGGIASPGGGPTGWKAAG